MTHGRKPRKPRLANQFAFAQAMLKATRLTEAEVLATMAPARDCETSLRTATASEDQYIVLHTALLIALEIERSGIVRGLHEHITTALQAMETIHARATASGAWRPTALHYYELDAIRTALDLHEYQLRQLSAGEIHEAARKLAARTLSSGGSVERITETELAARAV